MRKQLLLTGCLFLAIVGMFVVARSGNATQSYGNQFKALYVHSDKTDRVSVALAAAVKKANCTVCHLSGKMKKGRYNAYGKQLAKLLKKGDDKDTKKIHDALVKVFNMPSDPHNDQSPTFGSRIHRGKLPAGD
jgi:hypothetical protein